MCCKDEVEISSARQYQIAALPGGSSQPSVHFSIFASTSTAIPSPERTGVRPLQSIKITKQSIKPTLPLGVQAGVNKAAQSVPTRSNSERRRWQV